jgi:hypothetical protein
VAIAGRRHRNCPTSPIRRCALRGGLVSPLAQAASRQAETNAPGLRFPTIAARRDPRIPLVQRAEDFESATLALSFCSR